MLTKYLTDASFSCASNLSRLSLTLAKLSDWWKYVADKHTINWKTAGFQVLRVSLSQFSGRMLLLWSTSASYLMKKTQQAYVSWVGSSELFDIFQPSLYLKVCDKSQHINFSAIFIIIRRINLDGSNSVLESIRGQVNLMGCQFNFACST